jgi:hypothetical protein
MKGKWMFYGFTGIIISVLFLAGCYTAPPPVIYDASAPQEDLAYVRFSRNFHITSLNGKEVNWGYIFEPSLGALYEWSKAVDAATSTNRVVLPAGAYEFGCDIFVAVSLGSEAYGSGLTQVNVNKGLPFPKKGTGFTYTVEKGYLYDFSIECNAEPVNGTYDLAKGTSLVVRRQAAKNGIESIGTGFIGDVVAKIKFADQESWDPGKAP